MATSGVWTTAEMVASNLFDGEDARWNVKVIDGGYIITQVREGDDE